MLWNILHFPYLNLKPEYFSPLGLDVVAMVLCYSVLSKSDDLAFSGWFLVNPWNYLSKMPTNTIVVFKVCIEEDTVIVRMQMTESYIL